MGRSTYTIHSRIVIELVIPNGCDLLFVCVYMCASLSFASVQYVNHTIICYDPLCAPRLLPDRLE